MNVIEIYDHHYAVKCSRCNAKVMDPDKRINQIHLKGKCPSCGQNSQEFRKQKNKKNRKQKRNHIRVSMIADDEFETEPSALRGLDRFII
jgi:Zn finger protein HypA/HybF involved in hydrogenase expression